MSLVLTKYGKTKKYDNPLYNQPQSTQELFSVKGIDETGIYILNDNMYSKSYILSDINFSGVTDEEQKAIIINFSKALNSIPCRYSYTVANEYVDENVFNNSCIYKLQNDELDELRVAFNETISSKVTSARQGLYQTIYLTLTVTADSISDAKIEFRGIETSLSTVLMSIGINGMTGSSMEALDINKRMQLWFNFMHQGLKSKYKFDYHSCYKNDRAWIDIVAPESLEFFNDYFVINGNRYGRVMYFSKHAFKLDSDTLNRLTQINATHYITINSELLNQEAFKQEINRKSSKVGHQIQAQKNRNRQKADFLADASSKLLKEQASLDDLSEDVENGDDHYFNTTVLIMFLSKSIEELDEITTKINSIAGIKGFEVKPCFAMQYKGLNSCFMFGLQEFKRVTNLSAPCEAMYMPFKTQELHDETGTFKGINKLSQNSIMADRKLLQSCHGVILGKTRSGKSVFAKLEILSTRCVHPEEQILIIDPQGEYKKIANIKGVNASVVSFDTQKDIYVNPLDVNFDGIDYSDLQDIIADKIDFIITLLSSCIRREINTAEQGVLDNIISQIYSENYAFRRKLNGETENESEYAVPGYMQTAEIITPINAALTQEEQERIYSPTLQDVYQKLIDQRDNPIAQNLAGYMRIFVNGSLDLFNHKTNIDLNKPFLIFDISCLKDNLRIPSMLAMLEIVHNKIKWNFAKNNWTNIYIDEFHELLKIPAVADYVIRLWKEAGKIKGSMTGITQNMTDLLNNSTDSHKLAAILSNTEYFAMLNQSTIDRNILEDFLPSISPAMFKYVEEVPTGTGLLRMGSITVPFDITIDKSSYLYKYINTDGNDGVGAI